MVLAQILVVLFSVFGVAKDDSAHPTSIVGKWEFVESHDSLGTTKPWQYPFKYLIFDNTSYKYFATNGMVSNLGSFTSGKYSIAHSPIIDKIDIYNFNRSGDVSIRKGIIQRSGNILKISISNLNEERPLDFSSKSKVKIETWKLVNDKPDK